MLRKRTVIKVVAILFIIIFLGSCIGAYFWVSRIYVKNFAYRCTTDLNGLLRFSQLQGLTRERHTFASNNGQTLVGYLYEREGVAAANKGIVVFAHGLGGGGQKGYVDIFDHLTKNGYYVFAYDATGNDESEGEVIGGLPQGIIDLDFAIDYVHTIEKTQSLPIMLMGYSWGGFSVVNVLNYHPEVQAVVSMAGFNKSMNLLEDRSCQVAGDLAKLVLPFAQIYEYSKYGKYALSSAMEGFATSDCDVMIVHGQKDDIVPIEYGYDTYYKKYGNDERFRFCKYENRDHSIFTNDDGTLDFELMNDAVEFFNQSLKK